MKLETSEADLAWVRERVDYVRAQGGPFMTDDRVYCDFLALLAERDPAPPLPEEVEEMRSELDLTAKMLRTQAEECFPEVNEAGQKHFMRVVMESAAEAIDPVISLLSRWPGGWRPIETAPKDSHILVWAPGAHGLPAMFSVCQWHPDAGFCIDDLRTPTHWSPLPEPPHE